MAPKEPAHDKVYDLASIQISELIGRTFNNPLGEYPFERFGNLFAGGKRILDIGSGRGRAAILVAQRFDAEVVAVEASEEMAQFATHLVAEAKLENHIRVLRAEFLNAQFEPESFDHAMCFDVLSYFPDKNAFFRKVAQVLRASGSFLFSDYFCSDPQNPRIHALAQAWGIEVPSDFNSYPSALSNMGFSVEHVENTTATYYEHWTEVKRRCLDKKDYLIARTSLQSVNRYLSSIDTILTAVQTGAFGHLFCTATRLSLSRPQQ